MSGSLGLASYDDNDFYFVNIVDDNDNDTTLPWLKNSSLQLFCDNDEYNIYRNNDSNDSTYSIDQMTSLMLYHILIMMIIMMVMIMILMMIRNLVCMHQHHDKMPLLMIEISLDLIMIFMVIIIVMRWCWWWWWWWLL